MLNINDVKDMGNANPEYMTMFFCVILALLGGTARELSKEDERFEWKRFFSRIFTSAFSGVLIGLFAPDFEHKNWIMALAGVAGLAGPLFTEECIKILKMVMTHFAYSVVNKDQASRQILNESTMKDDSNDK